MPSSCILGYSVCRWQKWWSVLRKINWFNSFVPFKWRAKIHRRFPFFRLGPHVPFHPKTSCVHQIPFQRLICRCTQVYHTIINILRDISESLTASLLKAAWITRKMYMWQICACPSSFIVSCIIMHELIYIYGIYNVLTCMYSIIIMWCALALSNMHNKLY